MQNLAARKLSPAINDSTSLAHRYKISRVTGKASSLALFCLLLLIAVNMRGQDLNNSNASVKDNTDDIAAEPYQDSESATTRGEGFLVAQLATKLTANDGSAHDEFGKAVAISGDTAVVGAYFDANGSKEKQGAAYVFVRNNTSWIFQAKLQASDGAAFDRFGNSVAIEGNTIIVGAYFKNSINFGFQGAAYVFVRTGTSWTQQAKLTAIDGRGGDEFGASVAISGNTALIGARADSGAFQNQQGAAYIFVRSGTSWTEQTKLIAPDNVPRNEFGLSVSLNGNTAVVGSVVFDFANTGFRGAGYVFVGGGSSWSLQTKLLAPDSDRFDHFGKSVAIEGDTAFIGAPTDNIGANEAQGSAYLFLRSGTTWSQPLRLTASDGTAGDEFGTSVAVSANIAVIGARALTIGSSYPQGFAYIFVRNGVTWTQQEKLTASDGETQDQFGQSVSVSGGKVIAGAFWDDIGSNVDQGSAYIFDNGLSDCIYTFSPTSQSFQRAGGSSNFNINAGAHCAWTASSNVPWIKVHSGSAGSGNGAVGYSVLVNPVNSPRSGTIIVGTQTFTVTQEASGIVNGQIVLVSRFNPGGGFGIYKMNADGSVKTQLTNQQNDNNPQWSPDGTRILFSRVNQTTGDSNVYVMNADGTNQLKLTNHPIGELQPSWSPDGTKIVYVCGRNTTGSYAGEICTSNANGTGELRLTFGGKNESTPKWSPDGTKILYADDSSGFSSISVMNTDGTNITLLTDPNYNFQPDWSPDGSKVTYTTFRNSLGEIYVMNADGTSNTQLTTTAPGESSESSWSPDGSKISFKRIPTNTGIPHIYTMNADGTNQQPSTTADSANLTPDWQALRVATPTPTPTPSPTPNPGLSSLQFSSNAYAATEGVNNGVLINVTRAGDSSGTATVSYKTSNGTALDTSDYTASTGTLNFAAGDASKTFTILITNDAFSEGAETVGLTIESALGSGVSLGFPSIATLTIHSNDPTDGTSPVKWDAAFDSTFFVRQHYSDFFNREPDASGLAFWKNQIDECLTEECRGSRRSNVSAAFFLSIEFQETGFLVYRAHEVAFDSVPGSPSPVTMQDFLRDQGQIGQGLVVGSTGWEQKLEANKAAYFTSLTLRAAFMTAYPASMTPQQFVDKLNLRAGGALSQSESMDLVNRLTTDQLSRAQVLRAVAEDRTLFDAEFRRAFVYMQYVGYLRRDPDQSGFDYWLSKLNDHNGNYISAEMVTAFLLSSEYIERFGR